MSKKVKVRAKTLGFYGSRRVRAGDVFEVVEGTKAAWFEVVDGSAEVTVPEVGELPTVPGQAPKPGEPVALSQLSKKRKQNAKAPETLSQAHDLVT